MHTHPTAYSSSGTAKRKYAEAMSSHSTDGGTSSDTSGSGTPSEELVEDGLVSSEWEEHKAKVTKSACDGDGTTEEEEDEVSEQGP